MTRFSFCLEHRTGEKGNRAVPSRVRRGHQNVHELQVRHDVLGRGRRDLRVRAAAEGRKALQQHGGEHLIHYRCCGRI